MAIEQTGKVVLATGANRGLGREIARGLGRLGMTVLLGARNGDRGRDAANELQTEGLDARFVLIDVTDEAVVDAAAAKIEADFGRLDVLINNAGVGRADGQPSELDSEVLRHTFETNVFGTVTVTNAMPLLRHAPAPRIVNLSSPLGSLTLIGEASQTVSRMGQAWAAYNASKAALNALTLMYANEFRDSGMKVNAANPGFCATDMTNHMGNRSAEEGALVAVRLATLDKDGASGAFVDEQGTTPW
jgi:NAD(P)-dependent dehydrogenase (short-subunit alcohol dehydrogenase family)